jgi:hypothetical protein
LEIKKVLIRSDGIKYLIIPKKSKINAGDLVLVTNNTNLINKLKREEQK